MRSPSETCGALCLRAIAAALVLFLCCLVSALKGAPFVLAATFGVAAAVAAGAALAAALIERKCQ